MRGDAAIQHLISMGRLRVDAAKGAVYAPKSNTPNKPCGAKTRKGYRRVCVSVDNRKQYFLLHRIVWVSVHGPVPDGYQIDHGPCGKDDNGISNLEAVTGLENMRRAARDGLTNGGWRDGPRNPLTGQFVGRRRAGRLLDGVTHDALPEPPR
jgi:hypothetical protein